MNLQSTQWIKSLWYFCDPSTWHQSHRQTLACSRLRRRLQSRSEFSVSLPFPRRALEMGQPQLNLPKGCRSTCATGEGCWFTQALSCPQCHLPAPPVPLLIWYSVNQEDELASKVQAATSTWLWQRGSASEGSPGKSNTGRLWGRESANPACQSVCVCLIAACLYYGQHYNMPVTVLHLQTLLTS